MVIKEPTRYNFTINKIQGYTCTLYAHKFTKFSYILIPLLICVYVTLEQCKLSKAVHCSMFPFSYQTLCPVIIVYTNVFFSQNHTKNPVKCNLVETKTIPNKANQKYVKKRYCWDRRMKWTPVTLTMSLFTMFELKITFREWLKTYSEEHHVMQFILYYTPSAYLYVKRESMYGFHRRHTEIDLRLPKQYIKGQRSMHLWWAEGSTYLMRSYAGLNIPLAFDTIVWKRKEKKWYFDVEPTVKCCWDQFWSARI